MLIKASKDFNIDLTNSWMVGDRETDLQTLTATLTAMKLNYRVFTTEVALRGAKWSREQLN